MATSSIALLHVYSGDSFLSLFAQNLACSAVDRFQRIRGRYPGTVNKELTKDEDEVWEELQHLSSEVSLDGGEEGLGTVSPVKKEHAVEMTRYGAAEIHNIAAVVGGIGSQEAVKIITKQYVPLANTFIYNGISSVGATYDL